MSENEPPPDPQQQPPPTDLHLAAATPDMDAAGPTAVLARPTAVLARAAILREAARLAGPTHEPTSEEVEWMYRRQEEWDHCPVTRERMLTVNEMTQRFFEDALDHSWVSNYLARRLGVDLRGDERFRVGHAPDGWTTLVDHLRERGVNEEELLAAGVATLTRTNRLIDRFRDRLTLPILNPATPEEVLGFVARRNPECDNTHGQGAHAPKYLNTGTTPLFHKGDQLFGAHLARSSVHASTAIPVLVEGPLDALAVTLASAGRFAGVSPLGTALTCAQAKQLATLCHGQETDPLIATDADPAGADAAERDFWLLTEQGMDPSIARLEPGSDPASTLADHGAAALVGTLAEATALGDVLGSEACSGAKPDTDRALAILAARPSQCWERGIELIARQTEIPVKTLTASFAEAVEHWDTQPRLVVARRSSARHTARPLGQSAKHHHDPAARNSSGPRQMAATGAARPDGDSPQRAALVPDIG